MFECDHCGWEGAAEHFHEEIEDGASLLLCPTCASDWHAADATEDDADDEEGPCTCGCECSPGCLPGSVLRERRRRERDEHYADDPGRDDTWY